MITKEMKAELIAKYGRSEGDTGSPEVQIAILTARINDLQDHFKANPTRIPESKRYRALQNTDRAVRLKKIISW